MYTSNCILARHPFGSLFRLLEIRVLVVGQPIGRSSAESISMWMLKPRCQVATGNENEKKRLDMDERSFLRSSLLRTSRGLETSCVPFIKFHPTDEDCVQDMVEFVVCDNGIENSNIEATCREVVQAGNCVCGLVHVTTRKEVVLTLWMKNKKNARIMSNRVDIKTKVSGNLTTTTNRKEGRSRSQTAESISKWILNPRLNVT